MAMVEAEAVDSAMSMGFWLGFATALLPMIIFCAVLMAVIDSRWLADCVKHGAAVYVTEDGQPVWKWKDEVQ